MKIVTLLVLSLIALGGCGGGAEQEEPRTADDVAQAPPPVQAAPTPPPPAPEPPPPPPPPSLTQRLGGREAIAAVVHSMMDKVMADRRIKRLFRRANREQLEQLLTDQICQAGGGECQYAGRSMEETHHGMRVTDAHFDALVEDLTAALDEAHVPDAEKNELLGLLGPMRAQIVNQ